MLKIAIITIITKNEIYSLLLGLRSQNRLECLCRTENIQIFLRPKVESS